GHGACNLKRHFTRVDFVVATVVQLSFDVDYWVTGQDAVLHGFFNALFNWGDVLARYRATNDGVLEYEAVARLLWGQLEPHVTVLATTTRLADKLAFNFGGFLDSFAVRNLRFTNIGLHLKLALHTINNNV